MAWIDGGNPGATMAPALQDRPGHISWSQVKALHPAYERSCPAAWAYKKRLGIPGDDGGPGLHCGKAVDEAFQAYQIGRLIEDGGTMVSRTADMMDVAYEYMSTVPEAVWGGKAIAYMDAVGAALRKAAHYFEACRPAEVQSEYVWTLPDTAVRVVSYLDWVEEDGGIWDLKWTGSSIRDRAGNIDEAWLMPHRRQVVSYWMARAAHVAAGGDMNAPLRARGAGLLVIYHNIRNAEPQVFRIDLTLTRDEADIVRRHMIETDAMASLGRFPARPGKPCERCAYQTRCQRDLERSAPMVEDLSDAG